MKNFLNKIQNDKNKPLFRKPKRGVGKSLGGSKPGKVINIVLSNPGPLGVMVEKASNGKGFAIIASAVPGTQAEAAGLLRGDIVCHANCDGEEEIKYEQFLAMANSSRRPLVFDVRRIPVTSKTTSSTRSNAESEIRRNAVIAAAEARDKAHKKKVRPVPKTGHLTSTEKQKIEIQREEFATYNAEHMMKDKPLSEETKKAVEAAKTDEMSHAAALGYNPYLQANMSAGQAKTAVTTVTHGMLDAGEVAKNNASLPAATQQQPKGDAIHPVFDDAYTNLVTSNLDRQQIAQSLKIMRTLISNATTKGQQGDEELSSKFRKVRLSNPKIKAAITDMNGGIEVMIATGFELRELEGETHLVYPPGNNGPSWIPEALKHMERFAI